MVPRSATRPRGGRVSYRELSFESNNEEDTSYNSSDIDETSPAPKPLLTPRSASLITRRQSARTLGKNKIDTSAKASDDNDDDPDDDDDDLDEEDMLVEPRAKRRRIVRTAPARRSAPQAKPISTPKKPSSGAVRPIKGERSAAQVRWSGIPTDGFCPRWSSLPYEALLSVFSFALALYPNDNKRASSWLLSAASTCRTFSEPAISVLYHCPPVRDSRQLQALLDHLSEPSENHLFKYHPKVKRLDLDERIIPARFDLLKLISCLPQVAQIDINSGKDYALRGAPQISTERWWKYPDNFTEDLQAIDPPLKLWHSNAMLIDPVFQFRSLVIPIGSNRTDVLQSANPQEVARRLDRPDAAAATGKSNLYLSVNLYGPFLRLNELILTNYEVVLRPSPMELKPTQEPLANILAKLPLRRVRLEFCLLHPANPNWLILLPSNLRILEIHCCTGLLSEFLTSFLLSNGRELRKLTLDHNASLNLAFLSSLAFACPKLEELTMDLIYFSDQRVDEAVQPSYTELMPANTIPTWPSSLVKIDLKHLRCWSSDAAATFFDSLVGSAGELANLRHLALSASIDTDSWKLRAGFRDEWVPKFQKTFLRQSAPPSPHLASRKAFRLWKESQKPSDTGNYDLTRKGSSSADGTNRLRSRNLRNSSGPISSPHLSLRNKVLAALEDQSPAMCNVVDIRIDNARPRGKEWRESDMLDSEESGDEDWT